MRFDVVAVGGGPGGSTLAWDLARRGIEVALLERTRFPREKVCGDYVEPRGLRILDAMGCLDRIEATGPLPITHSATWVQGEERYRGPIPFYGLDEGIPPHGYIVPRDELDLATLQAAARSGATVHEETTVTAVSPGASGVEIEARRGAKTVRYRAQLVAGADGVNSVVGASAGVLVDDPRYTAVAQRAYATVDGDSGEAVFCFDEELFPGYGWLFPLAGGRANLGVGILSETRRRLGAHVPDLFSGFVDRLRAGHPRCTELELLSPPIGGIVKTYGGAGPNRFDGGVLIGDAGCFVDPMTGEGITPAMESALLAAPVLEAALAAGRFDAAQLEPYEAAFHAYFDPAMTFLDLCAATLRNRHLARPWLKALARGCELAQADETFARTAGSYFGGLDVRPFGILGRLWLRIAGDLLLAWPRSLAGGWGRRGSAETTVVDLLEWQSAWSRSLLADPVWHARWSLDLQRKWLRLVAALRDAGADPRSAGLLTP